MTSAKRRIDDQIAVAAKAPKLSLLRLQEVLQTNGKKLCRSMSDALDISTPFGKLLVTLRLPMIDGSNYNWLVCNPFAFLHLRCQRSEGFARLLFDSLKTINDQVHGTIALYSDESCHGNQLRHDSVNELQCIYWTICQLPAWYRMRKHGWFYAGFLRTDIQEKVQGGLSGVWKHVFNYFYSETMFNFATGMFLQAGSAGKRLFAIFLFACFVQDEKAHKGTQGVKGAAGWRCCLTCRNIWNCNKALPQGHYHYKTAVPSQFDLHTRDSFFEDVDLVASQCGVLSKTKFEQLQKNKGITFCPGGLALDLNARKYTCAPLNTFWDPMHCTVASSGVSQFEANSFAHACVSKGVPLERLDEFSSRVEWPSGRERGLPKNFFAKRVRKEGDHIKAFAAEVLTAVTVLMWFFRLVLQPAGLLEEHGQCLELLHCMHDILFGMGDEAVSFADLLESVIIVHHRLFLNLYGKAMAKIKFHFCYHFPMLLRMFGVNLNCFKPERMHSLAMAMAAHTTRQNQDAYILRRVLCAAFEDCDINDIQEVFLTNPKARPDLLDYIRPLEPAIGSSVLESGEICCGSLGRVRDGSLIVVSSKPGQFTIGMARSFCSCSVLGSGSAELRFFVGFARFQKKTDLEWVPMGGKIQFSPIRDMKLVVPFVRAGHAVVPLLPHEETLKARLT